MINLNDWLHEIVAGIVATSFLAVSYIIRVVFTNQKQILMLQKEILDRDQQRKEDREVWQSLKEDIKEIKKDILDIYKK